MRNVENVVDICLDISSDLILKKKFVTLKVVLDELKKREEQDKVGGNLYRVKLHNSIRAGKYNTPYIAGMQCMNVYKPRREDTGEASINLTFNVIKEEE